MKTGTLNQYLAALAEWPADATSQRTFATNTHHTLVQCISDGGYPAKVLATIPALKQGRKATRAHVADWWAALAAWLRTLTPRELRCLKREVVILPEHGVPPSGGRSRTKARGVLLLQDASKPMKAEGPWTAAMLRSDVRTSTASANRSKSCEASRQSEGAPRFSFGNSCEAQHATSATTA